MGFTFPQHEPQILIKPFSKLIMVEPQIFRGKCIDKQKGHHFENNVLTDTKFYGAVKNKNWKNNHQDVQHLAAYLFNGNGTKHSNSFVHPDQDEKKNQNSKVA